MQFVGTVQRCKKPVLVAAESFCRYRYIRCYERESRIRVSGTKLLDKVVYRNNRAVGSLLNCLLPAVISNKLNCFIGNRTLSTIATSNLDFLKTQTSTIMTEKKPFERLPTTVRPKTYKLHFKPDLKKFTFDGKETVDVVINEPVNKIVLNSLDLNYSKVELKHSNGSVLVPETSHSVENETLTLTFSSPVPKGEASISFEFIGELNDKLRGFYRSKCNSSEEKYAAVTQFQATCARSCFPCWDEPAVKAIFDITITAPKGCVALSNMPAVSEVEEANGDKTVTFGSTSIMSTYLVAMVVGEFDYVEDRSEDGVLVRVYTEAGKKEQGNFALFVATKVLPYYKEYFKIAYPLPKIDLVAVADFSAGAMENWGLVLYRETCLLVDLENTSSIRKQFIALIIGHELAHQWFGNLVTMEWWTDLWLNEGYASFVEYLCVAHLFPEYDIWTQFINEHIQGLELDSLENSHPIEVPVGHPSEIDEIFDDISYSKGASIIRMLHNYLGDEDFRKGMNIYLTRHQYKNTFTEDLWQALEEASSKPVKAVMSTWTRQKGFPMITVESVKSPDDNPNTRTIKVSQKKFFAAGNRAASDGVKDDGTLWMVPLTCCKASDPTENCHAVVLEKKEMTITIPNIKPDEWVKLNPSTVGFYRTNYPPEILDQFLPSIQMKKMPPLDRLGLVDDLFALVQAGHTSTVQVLKLMQSMTHEDNFTVWSTISNCLSKIGVLISHTDLDEPYKAFGKKLFKEIAKKMGWDAKNGESHLDALLRALAISRLGGTFQDKEIIEEAKKRFKSHVNGDTPIPADLRSPVYKAVLVDGDEETFKTMIKLYKEKDLHEEKDRIGRALGASQNKDVLLKALKFALSDDVRIQDAPSIICSVAINKIGRDLAWQLVKDNWSTIITNYKGGFLLGKLVKHSTEDFASEEKAIEVEEFFKSQSSQHVERTVQQSCETIRLNAAWLERDRDQIKQFLTSVN